MLMFLRDTLSLIFLFICYEWRIESHRHPIFLNHLSLLFAPVVIELAMLTISAFNEM